MKFELRARRLESRPAEGAPVTVTLRIRSLQVNSALPFGRRSFTEGLLEGIARQMAGHIESIATDARNLQGTVALSLPAVTVPLSGGLGFTSGRNIGDSCAGAFTASWEKTHAS